MNTYSYHSKSPTHSYTHYHECSGTVIDHGDGTVTVNTDCESASRYNVTPRFGVRLAVGEALARFRTFDHNGAGQRLRDILRRIASGG